MLPALLDSSDISLRNITNIPNFENMIKKEIMIYIELNSHCSELVKLANDSSDIWFGHNRWNDYSYMIRIFKEYRFVSNTKIEKSKASIFLHIQ